MSAWLDPEYIALDTEGIEAFLAESLTELARQAWRLSGVASAEVTSLGCHTDLWQPLGGGASPIALRLVDSALAPVALLSRIEPLRLDLTGLRRQWRADAEHLESALHRRDYAVGGALFGGDSFLGRWYGRHSLAQSSCSAPTQALLVDRDTLDELQNDNDALMASQSLKRAFTTDVAPILARARESLGTAIDPIATYRRSQYRAECARRRPAQDAPRSGIV